MGGLTVSETPWAAADHKAPRPQTGRLRSRLWEAPGVRSPVLSRSPGQDASQSSGTARGGGAQTRRQQFRRPHRRPPGWGPVERCSLFRGFGGELGRSKLQKRFPMLQFPPSASARWPSGHKNRRASPRGGRRQGRIGHPGELRDPAARAEGPSGCCTELFTPSAFRNDLRRLGIQAWTSRKQNGELGKAHSRCKRGNPRKNRSSDVSKGTHTGPSSWS